MSGSVSLLTYGLLLCRKAVEVLRSTGLVDLVLDLCRSEDTIRPKGMFGRVCIAIAIARYWVGYGEERSEGEM